MAWSLQRLGRLAAILPLLVTFDCHCSTSLEKSEVSLLITFGCRTWWRPSSEKWGARHQLLTFTLGHFWLSQLLFKSPEVNTLARFPGDSQSMLDSPHHHQFFFQISELSSTLTITARSPIWLTLFFWSHFLLLFLLLLLLLLLLLQLLLPTLNRKLQCFPLLGFPPFLRWSALKNWNWTFDSQNFVSYYNHIT